MPEYIDNKLVLQIAAIALLIGGMVAMWSQGYRSRRLFKRGLAHLDANKPAQALTVFESVVKMQPLWSPARRILARLYAQAGRVADAEKQLTLVTQFEPRNAEALVELGLFAIHYGGPAGIEKAYAHFTQARGLAPRIFDSLGTEKEFEALRTHPKFREFFETAQPRA